MVNALLQIGFLPFFKRAKWPRGIVGSEHKLRSRIVSVHFPKAAGSSLKEQFVHLLGDLVYLDYARGPLAADDSGISDFPEGKVLVHGHFPAARYASSLATMITFLREPVDNLISIYFFWRAFAKPTNALHARFLAERPSLPAFARYPKIQRLMSQTYFGNVDLRRFSFVGFHETRDADMLRLSSLLELPLDPSLHLNKTKEFADRDIVSQDRSVTDALKDVLYDDVSFYWNARRQFGTS